MVCRSMTRLRYDEDASCATVEETDWKKLASSSHFTNDLGLDSLDTVEVVMAIEEVCCYGYRDPLASCIDDMTGVQHRDSRQGGGRDPQRYAMATDASLRWHTLMSCSKPSGGVHHGAARWYVQACKCINTHD